MIWTPEKQMNLYEKMGFQTGSPQQDAFLTDWQHRYQVVVCPRRSSKSYTAAKKAIPIVLGRETNPDGTPKPTRTWIVGPTYELAEKEFRYIWEDLVTTLPKLGLPKPAVVRDSKKAGDLYIRTAWRSEISAKSADKPQSLLGEAVDLVIMAEAAQFPTAEVWERFLEPSLSTTRGFALFPTTPNASAQWLYDLWMKGLDTNEPMVASYSWPVTANPVFPPEELEERRRFYGETSPVFREQYLGEWVFYSGTVYGGDFNPQRNVVPLYSIPDQNRVIRAIDFGYRDPFVCKWYHVTQDGGLDCFREYYLSGKTLDVHAKTINALTDGRPVYYTVADSSEPGLIESLRRHGIPCLQANRDRRAGRLAVGEAYRTGHLRYMEGRCPNTLRELSFYRWDEAALREGQREKTLGEDHAMDTDRYAMMSRPRPTPVPQPVPRQTFDKLMADRRRERIARMWPHAVAR